MHTPLLIFVASLLFIIIIIATTLVAASANSGFKPSPATIRSEEAQRVRPTDSFPDLPTSLLDLIQLLESDDETPTDPRILAAKPLVAKRNQKICNDLTALIEADRVTFKEKVRNAETGLLNDEELGRLHAKTMVRVGKLFSLKCSEARAMAYLSEALDIGRELASGNPAGAPPSATEAETLTELGRAMLKAGRRDEAVQVLQQALNIQRKLGEIPSKDKNNPQKIYTIHEHVVLSLFDLGDALCKIERCHEGLPMLRDAVEMNRRYAMKLKGGDAATQAELDAEIQDEAERLKHYERTAHLLEQTGAHLVRYNTQGGAAAGSGDAAQRREGVEHVTNAVRLRRQLDEEQKEKHVAWQGKIKSQVEKNEQMHPKLDKEDQQAEDDRMAREEAIEQRKLDVRALALADSLCHAGGHIAAAGDEESAVLMLRECLSIKRRLAGSGSKSGAGADDVEVANLLRSVGQGVEALAKGGADSDEAREGRRMQEESKEMFERIHAEAESQRKQATDL